MVVARYLYGPFGNALSLSGPLAEANLYRFSSQEFHANSGLILYLRRAYAANLQRFINRDSIMELGGLNLYRFAQNSPLNRFDSWGLDDSMDELNRLIPGDHVARVRDLYANDPDTQDNLMDTVGPLIDPSWANFCRAGQKLYDFFDPPRQLREGLHMLPLLSLLAGQPELAALFSFTDAALYASEGNIKGTVLAGLGALPIAGVIGKAAEGALYEVGLAKELRKAGSVFTEVHHVPQTAQARSLVGDLNLANKVGNEPAIRLSISEHAAVSAAQAAREVLPATARQLLAQDIRILRNYAGAPNSALQQLIELNKSLHYYDYVKLR